MSLLASCAPQPTATPAPAPTKAQAGTAAPQATAVPATAAPAKADTTKITLRVTANPGDDAKLQAGFAQKYMEMYPNVTIKIEEAGQLNDQTPLAAAAGNLADVLVQVHNRWFSMWCYKGYYLPLDDLMAANPQAIPDPKDIYPIGWEAAKFEGKLYGVPRATWPGSAYGIIMNRNLFEKAKVDMPKGEVDIYTVQELAFKLANKKEGIFGIQMVTHKQNRLANTLRFWGKPEYGVNGDTSSWPSSPDGKKWRYYDNPACDEWYNKWYRPLLEAGAAVKPQDETDAAGQGELFVLGRVAMLQGYHRDPQRCWLRIGDKWKFYREDACLLKGPQGRYGTCQENYNDCIGFQSKVPQEALKYIGFETNYENQLAQMEVTGRIISRHKVYTESPLSKTTPLYKAAAELLVSGKVEPYTLPWNFRDDEARDKYYNTTLPLYNCTKTWKEQAPISQAEVQKVYDEPRP